MIKNNSIENLSIWESFVKSGKNFYFSLRKTLRDFSIKYPATTQVIQISFIYFFAFVDLSHSILSNIFTLGYFPELLKPLYPYIKSILVSPILKAWASPEKVFFLSYVAIEFMVVRQTFKFSKLIKYNILLIFSLLMIQGLAITYWDLLFHRQISTSVAKWTYDQGALIYTDKRLAVFFFLNTFLVFASTYIYLYTRALNGKFATIPGLEWLTDSVAFWLRIKTPTMRFGKRKKK
jgi:hypothetical protein